MLEASDDLAEMSAIVAAMSTEDLERGMDLAALYGELAVASDMMEALDMPVMAAFLADRDIGCARFPWMNGQSG